MEEQMHDLKEFKAKVREEYYSYKSLEEIRKIPVRDTEKGFRGSLFGCLFIPLIRLLDPYGKKIIRQKYEENYSPYRSQVDAIVQNDLMKSSLCSALRDLPNTEIVTEDVFINVLTDTLIEPQLETPPIPALYALVGNKIFALGVRSFCRDADGS
jgi:hypothetical protein